MNPERLAYLETAIWKAYYDRRWLAVLWLTLQLVHEQFHLSWLQAIRASYCTTRAAVAWAPVDHDVAKVRRYLARFYELAGVRDPRRLAELHAALFGLPVEQTRTSGIARARAADTVDEITSGRSQDVPADWAKVETYLREA